MHTNWKLASGSWVVGSQRDRFTDYKGNRSLPEKIELLSSIAGLQGVEIIHPYDNIDLPRVKEALQQYDMQVIAVLAGGINDFNYRFGGLITSDQELRKKVVAEIEGAIDVARALNCATITLWPGQDGFDYPFQLDYTVSWQNLTGILQEITAGAPDISFCLEYKPREPRIFSTVDSMAKSLLLCETLGAPNLGITLDFGHSILAQENPAEAVALAQHYGRLKHIHLNDCFGNWDDDLIVGSVHFWQTVEFLWQLKKVGYEGWISLDISPHREDALESAKLSFATITNIVGKLEGIEEAALLKAQLKADAVEARKILQKVFLA